jgi:Protein of unknown function (DUF2798)
MSHAIKQRLLSSFIMSLLLSGLMSAWVTWLNLGLVGDFVSRWLHARRQPRRAPRCPGGHASGRDSGQQSALTHHIAPASELTLKAP